MLPRVHRVQRCHYAGSMPYGNPPRPSAPRISVRRDFCDALARDSAGQNMGLAKKRPAERRAPRLDAEADADDDLRADPEDRVSAPIKLKDRRRPLTEVLDEPDDEDDEPPRLRKAK